MGLVHLCLKTKQYHKVLLFVVEHLRMEQIHYYWFSISLVSQTLASEQIEDVGMQVVGWYHSHPTFSPDPSVRDIETQQKFQVSLSAFPPFAVICFMNCKVGCVNECNTGQYLRKPIPLLMMICGLASVIDLTSI